MIKLLICTLHHAIKSIKTMSVNNSTSHWITNRLQY